MDNKHDILELLRQVADGKVSPENAMEGHAGVEGGAL